GHFDNLLERNVPVGVRAQGGIAHAGNELLEGGVGGQVDTDRQGPLEMADQRLELRTLTVGHRQTDDDVLLSRDAREIGGEAAQEDFDSRHTQAMAQRLEPLAQTTAECKPLRGTPEAGLWRPQPVRGQAQRPRRTVEGLLPVTQPRLQRLPLEVAPLLARVAQVVHGQLGE
ncbi:hypothetical protein STIAU_8751, partial [Stigmatella aurantiaca DW4/3-1]